MLASLANDCQTQCLPLSHPQQTYAQLVKGCRASADCCGQQQNGDMVMCCCPTQKSCTMAAAVCRAEICVLEVSIYPTLEVCAKLEHFLIQVWPRNSCCTNTENQVFDCIYTSSGVMNVSSVPWLSGPNCLVSSAKEPVHACAAASSCNAPLQQISLICSSVDHDPAATVRKGCWLLENTCCRKLTGKLTLFTQASLL